MVEEDVVKGRTTPNSVTEPDGRSTRCWCPWRGRCEGARGHEGARGDTGSSLTLSCASIMAPISTSGSTKASRPQYAAYHSKVRLICEHTHTHKREGRSRESEGVRQSSPSPHPLRAPRPRPIGPSLPRHRHHSSCQYHSLQRRTARKTHAID